MISLRGWSPAGRQCKTFSPDYWQPHRHLLKYLHLRVTQLWGSKSNTRLALGSPCGTAARLNRTMSIPVGRRMDAADDDTALIIMQPQGEPDLGTDPSQFDGAAASRAASFAS